MPQGKLLLFLLLLALTSCGPMYETNYTFTPPESSAGNACIFQCQNSQQQCRQLEEYKKDDCEQRSEWQKERCEAEVWRKKGRDPKWYECGGESCSADYDRCDVSYRACYQSCGGKVQSETRCVANCDQIPPQGQAPGR